MEILSVDQDKSEFEGRTFVEEEWLHKRVRRGGLSNVPLKEEGVLADRETWRCGGEEERGESCLSFEVSVTTSGIAGDPIKLLSSPAVTTSIGFENSKTTKAIS